MGAEGARRHGWLDAQHVQRGPASPGDAWKPNYSDRRSPANRKLGGSGNLEERLFHRTCEQHIVLVGEGQLLSRSITTSREGEPFLVRQ